MKQTITFEIPEGKEKSGSGRILRAMLLMAPSTGRALTLDKGDDTDEWTRKIMEEQVGKSQEDFAQAAQDLQILSRSAALLATAFSIYGLAAGIGLTPDQILAADDRRQQRRGL